MKSVTGVGGKLRLGTELQPIGKAVFEFMDSGLAPAQHEIVLKLQLAGLDDRAADLEVVTPLRRKIITADRQEAGQDYANATKTHGAAPAENTRKEKTRQLCRLWRDRPERVATLPRRSRRGRTEEPHKPADDEQRPEVE